MRRPAAVHVSCAAGSRPIKIEASGRGARRHDDGRRRSARGLGRARSGGIVRDRADRIVAGEARAAHRPREALRGLGRGRGRPMHPGEGHARVVGRGRVAAHGRVAEAEGERRASGDLVACGEHVGRGARSAARRRGERSVRHDAGQVVHAHAARDRDASADGRGARVPRDAGRLLGRARPRAGPHRLGRQGAPGVGAVPVRKDEPELLDERPRADRGAVLRGDGEDERPHARGSRSARGRGLLERRGVCGRALRRHDADVPQQPVPRRPARRPVRLRVGGRGRGEVGPRLQPRQPRRDPRPRRAAACATSAAGRDLSEGRHALLRQPADRARRPVGVAAGAGRRRTGSPSS